MMLVKFYKFYAFMFINIFVNFGSVFICGSIRTEKLHHFSLVLKVIRP